MQNRVRGLTELPKEAESSRMGEHIDFFVDFDLRRGAPGDPQKVKNGGQQLSKIMELSKNIFFDVFSEFAGCARTLWIDFGSQNDARKDHFSAFWRKRRFCQNRAPTVAGAQISRVAPSKN